MGTEFQLDDVLTTAQLYRRNTRAPNLTAENSALHDLAESLGNSPQAALQQILQTALHLCDAGTIGVSLLERAEDGELIFRWVAVAGKLAHQVGGWTPRHHSPCGVTLDLFVPQLFSFPARYFTYFAAAEPPIIEGLVVPFADGETPWGTLWVVSHDRKHEFDLEDVRVMRSLCGFTTAVLRLMGHSSRSFSSDCPNTAQLPLAFA